MKRTARFWIYKSDNAERPWAVARRSQLSGVYLRIAYFASWREAVNYLTEGGVPL